MSERYLSEAERILISDGLEAQRTIRSIASELGRSPSTVSREINRNSDPASGRYLPFRAHGRAVARRARPKSGKLATSAELRAIVQERLDRRWSPEQISKTLQVEFEHRPEIRVSVEAIYQAVYTPRLGALERHGARVLRTGRSRRRPRRRLDRRMTRFVEPIDVASVPPGTPRRAAQTALTGTGSEKEAPTNPAPRRPGLGRPERRAGRDCDVGRSGQEAPT